MPRSLLKIRSGVQHRKLRILWNQHGQKPKSGGGSNGSRMSILWRLSNPKPISRDIRKDWHRLNKKWR
ncbi:hypothetical protein D3C73_1559220 [compost metagenome]